MFLPLHLNGCDPLTFMEVLRQQWFPIFPVLSFSILSFFLCHPTFPLVPSLGGEAFSCSSFQSWWSPTALQPWLQNLLGEMLTCFSASYKETGYVFRCLRASDAREHQMPTFVQFKPFSKSAQWYHFPYGDTDICISCPSFMQMGISLPHFRALLWAHSL